MNVACSVVDSITLNKECIPYYNKDRGIIVDSTNNTLLYKFTFKEWQPYYYYQITFVEYLYQKLYIFDNNVVQKKVQQKKYNVVLVVNFHNINNVIQSKALMKRISCVLINFSKSIKKETLIASEFIESRQKNLIKISAWNIYEFDNNIYFDLHKRRIVENKMIEHNSLQFKKYGGIIETNDLCNLYTKFKLINKKTLVIVPSDTNINKIIANCQYIKYSDLFFVNTNINKIFTTKWDTLIIHEVHEKMYSTLKKYLKNIVHNHLWIVNTLPLVYYFDSEKNGKSVSSRASLMNFWLCIDNENKKIYKNDIVNFVCKNTHLFYKKINFQTVYENVVTLQTTRIEKHVFDIISKFYIEWISNIRQCNWSDIKKIKSKIINTTYTILASFSKPIYLNSFFKSKCNAILQNLVSEKTNTLNIIEQYSNSNTFNSYINDNYLKKTNKNHEYILNKNKNYDRYCKINYSNIVAETCSICYCNFDGQNNHWVITICGHVMCIECAINAISYSNECPLCREYITHDKILIIGDNQNISSYIMDNIANNILVTNCKGLCNLELHSNLNITVLYVNDKNLNTKLSSISNKIIVSSDLFVIDKYKNDSRIYQIINHFKSINLNLNVNYLKFDFNLN